jgi:SulP family sulfate permease
MDYTAAHLFDQMHAQLAERGGQLLFSGMPSGMLDERDFARYLAQLGVVKEGAGIRISETLDGGLEWIEERILESAGVQMKGDEQPLEIGGFDLFREFDGQTLCELLSCTRAVSLAPGEKAFSQGEVGDELFLIRRGSVGIMLPLEGGTAHHLATIGRGDFFGELSFLDRGARSADVVAKVQTDLYVLTRERFNEVSKSHPTIGVQVFARLAYAIALRLRQTDAELRALEER